MKLNRPDGVARDGARLGQLAGAYGAAHHTAELAAPQLRDVAARVGPVDHVVCATGVDVRKGLDAHTDQEVELELAVDLAGPIHVARAFLPCLRPGGVIALFGGFGDGTLTLPYYSVDVAARAGLAGFCSAVNRELAALTSERTSSLSDFGAKAALSGSGNRAVVGASSDNDLGSDAGAVHSFLRTGTSWAEEELKLFAADGGPVDLFGSSVTVSGSTLFVGAYFHDVLGFTTRAFAPIRRRPWSALAGQRNH